MSDTVGARILYPSAVSEKFQNGCRMVLEPLPVSEGFYKGFRPSPVSEGCVLSLWIASTPSPSMFFLYESLAASPCPA